MNKLQLMVS